MTSRAGVPAVRGIAARLVIAMTLVVIAGGLTAFLVATLVGPALFLQHVTESGGASQDAIGHAEEAFRSASTLATTIALGSATVTSVAASVFLARRIGASLRTMAEASTRLAAGRFDTRVTAPGVGAEFDQLARAFNAMADRLDRDEQLRRRLTADVAHELRTPVATIAATLDALDDDVQQLTPATTAVLRAQASRLTRLSADLSDVSRVDSGNLHLHRQPLAPGAILSAAAAAAAGAYAAAGVTLVVDAPHLPDLPVDLDRLGQVFANLLDNALRHTPTGGTVRLSAAPTPSGVRFVVADNGEGIDQAHLPHLFERFYRVDAARDRAHGGSGIGLSITRALVHAHGGTVTAHSAGAGHGAEFLIELPLDGEDAARGAHLQ